MTFDAWRDGDPVAAAREMLGAPAEPSATVRALQVALSGWGYDFHNPANVARSNDLLVRARVAGWLRDGAAAIDDGERRYARERVVPATKERPFPDADVTRTLRALRALRDRLQSLAADIDALEVPAGDRVWNRFSRERPSLEALVTADIALLAYAQTIRTSALQLDGSALDALGTLAPIHATCDLLAGQIRARGDILRI